MKKTLGALVLGVLILGTMFATGCMKDPVLADIEAFDRHGSMSINDPAALDIEQRLLAARTPEERVRVLDEWIVLMDKAVGELASYKPRTPELTKITEGLNASLAASVDGAKAVRAAMLAEDSMKMNDAAIKVAEANTQLTEHMTDLRRLAASKGYKLKE